jgi:CheY-like chemotaxis protein
MMHRILIADDNPDDIEITKAALEEKGWDVQVEAQGNAEKALESLRGGGDLPSLLLLDLNIPGMGGIACLRQIRADRSLQSLPVIMVTMSSFDQDEQKAYEAGANLFLYKDIDLDRFSENLDAALKRLLA